MEWIHIIDQKPMNGQDCLVWDIRYKTYAKAYWDSDKQEFAEYIKGVYRSVMAHYWMPGPCEPGGSHE